MDPQSQRRTAEGVASRAVRASGGRARERSGHRCTITSSTPYVAASSRTCSAAPLGVADHPALPHRRRQAPGARARSASASSTSAAGQRLAGAQRDHRLQLRQGERSASSGLRHHGVDGEEGARLGVLGEGRKPSRYSASASAVPWPEKWWAKTYGSPSRRPAAPSSPTDPSSHRSGADGAAGSRAARGAAATEPGALGRHQRRRCRRRTPGSARPRRVHAAGAVAQRPARSPGRCPAPGRCRGRSGRGRPPRAARTARRPPGARGWAASRRPSRRGSARWPPPPSRSAPAGWSPPRPACCGARPASSGGSRARSARRASSGVAARASPVVWSLRTGTRSSTDRAGEVTACAAAARRTGYSRGARTGVAIDPHHVAQVPTRVAGVRSPRRSRTGRI